MLLVPKKNSGFLPKPEFYGVQNSRVAKYAVLEKS